MNYKNLTNENSIIKSITSLYPLSVGIDLFKKFNDVFYMKKIKAGSNITVNESLTGEIIISSGNNTDNILKLLVEGVSGNNTILTLNSLKPLFIHGSGASDILLNFQSYVETESNYIGVFNVEDDFNIVGNNTNLQIQLLNTGKQFSYVFEIISKSVVTYTSSYSVTVLS